MLTKVSKKTIRVPANVEVRSNKGSVYVTWGSAQGHGANESEALADLAKCAGDFFEDPIFPKYRWAGDSLFVLYRTPCGWAYDIVHHGNNIASSCLMSATGEREALEAMERHVAQYTESAAD